MPEHFDMPTTASRPTADERINPNPASSYLPPAAPQQAKPDMKPYVIGAVLTGLVLLLGYQQMQINHLSSELGAVSSDVRSGETRGRLEAVDARLQEINTRITYLDSKINATDQKAQSALDKLKIQEEKADWWGNMLKSVGLK